MKYCPNCGKEVADNIRYCTNCGNEVSKGNSSTNSSYNKTRRCKYCHNEIETGVTVCPVCRKRQSGSQGCLVAIALIVVFIFIVGNIGSLLKSFNFDFDENELQDNVEKNIGDELICSDYKVVINEYKIKTGAIDSWQEVPAGTEWIGLIVTATNTSNDEVTISSSNFELTNSNGEVLTYDVISYKVYGNYDTLGGTLAPGGTKTGYINFSNNNTDNSNLTVKFECGFWQSGSYIVRLK